jgi:hypothetical protein
VKGFVTPLLFIVFVQVALGVEAYLGKFTATGPFANLPPSQRPISNAAALTRTAHVVVGLFLLATLVAAIVRTFRKPVPFVKMPTDPTTPEPVTV